MRLFHSRRNEALKHMTVFWVSTIVSHMISLRNIYNGKVKKLDEEKKNKGKGNM